MIREIRPSARSTYGGVLVCSSGNHTTTSLLACSITLQECHCCVFYSSVVLHCTWKGYECLRDPKDPSLFLPSNGLSDYPELKSATKTDIKLVYDIYKHIRLFTVKVKIERNEVYYQIDSVKNQ